MPMLGEILAAARRSSGEFQAWLRASDPERAAEIEKAAARLRESPTSYVRAAVAEFSRSASEEDWATLTSRMKNSDDPGTVCLLMMVEWSLAADRAEAHP